MIKDVIVNLTKQVSPLSVSGFGMPLILATNATKSYAEYSSITAVAVDYAANTNAYKMASAMFAQNPKPSKIAIKGASYTQVEMTRASLTTSLAGSNNNLKYTSKLVGTAGNYTKIAYVNPGATTPTTTAAVTGTGTALDPYVITVTLSYATGAITAKASDVQAAIASTTAANALVSIENATGNDGTGIVTALTAISLTGGTAGSDATPLITALDTLVGTENDWFYLCCDVHGYNEIVALSAWANLNEKFYTAVTKDDGLIESGVINSDMTILFYHDQDTTYPDSALIGYLAGNIPGTYTMKFRTLEGVSLASVDDAKVLDLSSKYVNTYVNKYGIYQLSEGFCSSGVYIDEIVGIYWIKTKVEQEETIMLIRTKKVTYDSDGLNQILAKLLDILREGAANNIIAKDSSGKGLYSASVPALSDIPQEDVLNRHVPDVIFSFTVGNAVHELTVNGTFILG